MWCDCGTTLSHGTGMTVGRTSVRCRGRCSSLIARLLRTARATCDRLQQVTPMESNANVAANGASVAPTQNKGNYRAKMARTASAKSDGARSDFSLGDSDVPLEKFDVARSETYKTMRAAVYALRFVALCTSTRAACSTEGKVSMLRQNEGELSAWQVCMQHASVADGRAQDAAVGGARAHRTCALRGAGARRRARLLVLHLVDGL